MFDGGLNTSMLGGSAGLGGGALSCGDSYATGDNRLPKVMGSTRTRKPWAARPYTGGGSGVHGNIKPLKKKDAKGK